MTDPQKQHDAEKYVAKQELKKTEEPKFNKKNKTIMDSTKPMMDILCDFFFPTQNSTTSLRNTTSK